MMQELPILRPHRLVESERHGRARDFGLVGLRIDQDVDRIADREHADEYQHRHDEQCDYTLQDPADDEYEHGYLVMNRNGKARRLDSPNSSSPILTAFTLIFTLP